MHVADARDAAHTRELDFVAGEVALQQHLVTGGQPQPRRVHLEGDVPAAHPLPDRHPQQQLVLPLLVRYLKPFFLQDASIVLRESCWETCSRRPGRCQCASDAHAFDAHHVRA